MACGSMFQLASIFVFVTSVLAIQPLVQGMAFLEKVPPNFECLQQGSQPRMTPTGASEAMVWQHCEVKEICSMGLSRSQYRPVETDEEYLDNWVGKLDLLCKPKKELGFIGSCFFIGIISTMFWMPMLSDKIGRQYLILISFFVQLVAYLVLYQTSNLYVAFGCLIFMGTTFPGKHVVLYNYCLEMLPKAYHQSLINAIGFFETAVIIVIALFYNVISKSWKPMQFIGIIGTALALIFGCLFFCESPKFLYINGRFKEARESLKRIARFNGLPEKEISDRFNFQFDSEAVAGEVAVQSEAQSLQVARQITEQVHGQISDSQYYKNLAKMTIMWCASSFSCYLLNYMNKYLEGSIFQNHYNEGVAGLLAILAGAQIYSVLGKKRAFLLAFGLAFAGGLLIFLLESGIVVLPSSFLQHYQGKTISEKNEKALDFFVPKLIFFSKFGVALAFLFTYQASYQDDNIFPASKRASAIGQCQMIARGITVLAPEVSEFPKPIPITSFCAVILLAFIVSLTHHGPQTDEKLTVSAHRRALSITSQKGE